MNTSFPLAKRISLWLNPWLRKQTQIIGSRIRYGNQYILVLSRSNKHSNLQKQGNPKDATSVGWKRHSL